MEDKDTVKNGCELKLPIKPLFPVQSLFPIQEKSDIKLECPETLINKEINSENDLESLQLDINPATLNAIIAVQQQNADFTGSAEHRRKSRKSLSPVVSSSEKDRSIKRKKEKKKKKDKRKDSPAIFEAPENQEVTQRVPAGAVFLEDIPGLKPEHAFHIDKKSNRDLLHYECVSKRHIAKYRCHLHNYLGSLSSQIKRDKKSKHKSNGGRYFGKHAFRKLVSKGLATISSRQSLKHSDMVDSYIPIPKDTLPDKTQATIGSYSCLDNATKQYLQGVGTDFSKPLEENVEMHEIFDKIRSYNQRTRENPQDVRLWLEFIQFQDIVSQKNKLSKSSSALLRDVYRPPKSVIEKKLSIVDKAIELNPSSLELKLVSLELCQDLWEPEKCDKAWHDLLFTFSANVDLWREYLSNQQSRLVKFTFGHLLKLYHRCFQTIVPILDGQVKVASKPEDMEEKLVGLFAQYCDFLHHTGYTERAVSSYQAILELNLFCPPSLNLVAINKRLDAFKAFWDSGVPRFGEPNAKGWSHWLENVSNVYIPPSVNTDELEDQVILEKLPRSQTWLKMEIIRRDSHFLPWKPDPAKGETEESCEDPDRMVLFDYIKPALFRMTKSESCIRIICLFLKFLGLSSDTLDRRLFDVDADYNRTKFSQYGITGMVQCSSLVGFKSGLNVDSKWLPPEGLISFVREVLAQTESYFGSAERNMFTLLRLELEVLKSGASGITELSQSDMSAVKKFGKSLLKDRHNRSNLVVWNAYIRLLWACSDNMADTVSMMDAAMGMFTGSIPFSDVDKALGLCQLCKTYCEIILNFEPLEHISRAVKNSAPALEDKHLVVVCLGALVENKPFKTKGRAPITSSYVLKLRRRFESLLRELCDKLASHTHKVEQDLFVVFVECFALFEFSTSDFKTANEVFALAISQAEAKAVATNMIQHLYARHVSFITNVMGILMIPLSVLRQVLDAALAQFPQCAHFHAVLLRIESGAHIAGRLRKFYEKHLKATMSYILPLSYLTSELVRHQAILKSMNNIDGLHTNIEDSGSVNRIRSLFEHCVQLPGSNHCPLLWRLYLMFEAKNGTLGRAKGIFYRALQNCPWVKVIYMDGITLFGDSDLQEVIDLMTEKEIRVRIPLEEVDLLLNAETIDDEPGPLNDDGNETMDATVDVDVSDKTEDMTQGDDMTENVAEDDDEIDSDKAAVMKVDDEIDTVPKIHCSE